MIVKVVKKAAVRVAVMENKLDRKKVILGLSGGVDSAAATILLQKQGYEVIGLFYNVLSSFCINCHKKMASSRKKAEHS